MKKVTSPCIQQCRLSADNTCSGCRRTVDEISRWASCSEREKQAILERLAKNTAT